MPNALSAEQVFAWAEDLYTNAVDRKDAKGFANAFTATGTLRFGNNDTLHGPAAIEQAIAQFFTSFQSLTHESRGSFLANDILFLEAIVTYTRHDQRVVSIPALTVFHLAGANASGTLVADDCRIYVDLTPLYAP